MKISVWSAFASNNSGSYTIVGVFGEAAAAAEVARELAAVCAAHSAWHEANTWGASEGSPLHAFIVEHGLRWEPSRGGGDEWPQHGPMPSVAAIGPRVIVHAPYTVTMPPTFGELIYARGGRVEIEMNHAHEPIVAEIGIGWVYGTDAELVVRESGAVRAAIEADPIVQAALQRDGHGPDAPPRPGALRFRAARDWMEPALTAGALFDDLVGGVRAIAAIAERHGARHTLHVFEALDRDHPLAHFPEERTWPSS
jgi:hypothetical protein